MLSSRPVSRNAGIEGRNNLKTPARALLAENRIGPGTVNKKGKAAMQTPFQSKTPFLQKTLFTETDGQLKGGVRLQARPFGDKTPFPDRIVTANNTNQFQTPFLHHSLDGTPDSALRPSSTRKHIRIPRNSQKFETPANTKNHWDLNDTSDESIRIGTPEPLKVTAVSQEEDYDDIEYMPPNTLDLPYQPPFDFELPDYKVLGKAVMDASRNGWFLNDPEAPSPVFEIQPHYIETSEFALDFSSISNDDPFFDYVVKPQPASSASRPTKPQTKPVSTLASKTRPVPVPTPSLPSARSTVLGKPSRPALIALRKPTTTAGRTVASSAGSRPKVVQPSRTKQDQFSDGVMLNSDVVVPGITEDFMFDV
ncbi:hypothetical protein GYMLUDRAFT_644327 [Collybiopsis luxurians FD-317 M1]|nr:hypothetical protein GYMLUDRAFT_644327 [Collybiopsis luxurians FD-317 M1]